MIAGRKQLLIWSALSLTTGYAAPAFAQWVQISVPIDAYHAAWSQPLSDGCAGGMWGERHRWGMGNNSTLTVTTSAGPALGPQYVEGDTAIEQWQPYVESDWRDTPPSGEWPRCESEGWKDRISFLHTLYHTDWPELPTELLNDWRITVAETVYTDEPHGDGDTFTVDGPVIAWGSLPLVGGGSFPLASIAGGTTTVETFPGVLVIRIAQPVAADWNGDGAVNVPDVFGFLGEWFAGTARAGMCDGASGVEATDLFAFLTMWFEGQ